LISHYERLMRENPDNARGYHSLGILYSKLSDPQRAIEYYEKAISLDANLKEALFNLASTYQMLGQREKAIAFYERVLLLKSGPDDWIVWRLCIWPIWPGVLRSFKLCCVLFSIKKIGSLCVCGGRS
jgi:tetratricopeptide (TPR) repeat protein